MRRSLFVGLLVSLAAHGLVGVLLVGVPTIEFEDDEFLAVDVDVAPPPPEAVAPPPEDPASVTPIEPDDDAVPTPEPPNLDDDDGPAIDAGPPDAAVARDAAPLDAPVAVDAASLDAAPALDAGRVAVVAPSRDAGPDAEDAGPRPPDAGALALAPDAGPTTTALVTPDRAVTDLAPYVPPGDELVVVVRLDRLRRTPWATRAEAALAPMPDHRAIMGGRKTTMAAMFDVLVVSTRDPRDVAATHLAARSSMSDAALRRFLDQPGRPIQWTAVRGGALGRRAPSALLSPRDDRIYFMPLPGWVVLVAPRHLDELAAPPAAMASSSPPRPPWLDRLRDVAVETGEPTGPVVVVSLGRIPRTIRVPQAGALPGPRRASFAVDLVAGGFTVRGTMRFSDVARAEAFERGFVDARRSLTGSMLASAVLRNVHAYNALAGATLERREADIGFATSISGADAKAMLELIAEWARRFYAASSDATLAR